MQTLGELAALVGGTCHGDPQLEILRIRPLDSAGKGDITFLANRKYITKIAQTEASAIILPPGVDSPGKPYILCDNPYLAFAKVVEALHCSPVEVQGIAPEAFVDPTARVGENVTIAPGAVVQADVEIGDGTCLSPGVVLYKGAIIGQNCILHANAVVREGCILGNRVILQPAAVIGSDGFGYAPDGTTYYKIPQVGIVALEDDVEIGANSCIDRAAMGVTRIRRGAKIDNLVQIAHNVDIGEDTIIVSQVGIAGSTTIGNHCTFGGQSAAVGHVTIGDNVMLGARGALAGHTDGNQVLSGAPAIPHRQWLRAAKVMEKLPEMHRDLQQLKTQVEALRKELEDVEK